MFLNYLTRGRCTLRPQLLPERPQKNTFRNGWGKFCSIVPTLLQKTKQKNVLLPFWFKLTFGTFISNEGMAGYQKDVGPKFRSSILGTSQGFFQRITAKNIPSLLCFKYPKSTHVRGALVNCTFALYVGDAPKAQ